MNQQQIEKILDDLFQDHSIDYMLFLLAERDPNFVSRVITALVRQKDFQIDTAQREIADLAYSFSVYVNPQKEKKNLSVGRESYNGIKVLYEFFTGAKIAEYYKELINKIREKNPDLK